MTHYSKIHLAEIYSLRLKRGLLVMAAVVGLVLGSTIEAAVNQPAFPTKKQGFTNVHILPGKFAKRLITTGPKAKSIQAVLPKSLLPPVKIPHTRVSAPSSSSQFDRPKQRPTMHLNHELTAPPTNEWKGIAAARRLTVPGRKLFHTPKLPGRLQILHTKSDIAAIATYRFGRMNSIHKMANRARGIGEAQRRLRQAREMQKLHELGSPYDQARRGPGETGTQDCRDSRNPADCLRGHTVDQRDRSRQSNELPRNGEISARLHNCVRGADSAEQMLGCARHFGNRVTNSERMHAGPRTPTAGANILGRDQAAQDEGGDAGDVSGNTTSGHWNPWHARSLGHKGYIMSRSRTNSDGSTSTESHIQRPSGESEVIVDTVDSRGNSLDHLRIKSDRAGNATWIDWSTTDHDQGWSITTHSFGPPDHLRNIDMRISPITTTIGSGPPVTIPNRQPTPGVDTGWSNDDCHYNPVDHRCRTEGLSRSDIQGRISQPGREGDGESSGNHTGGSTAPHINSDAVTNTGGADWSATESGTSAQGSGPLDMRDPDHIPDGAGPRSG